MKHHLIVCCLFIALSTLCLAQKEIIFNDPAADKSQIKVAPSLMGVDFSFDPLMVFAPERSGRTFGTIETHLRFFHENRIANRWTLNKSIGFTNTFDRLPRLIEIPFEGGIAYGGSGDYQYRYNLSLQMMVEPRFYFSYVNRYRNSKVTEHNSGWFLAFPLTVSTLLYQQPYGLYTQSFSLQATLPISIGYRKSLSKNLFFEANAGYFPWTLSIWRGNVNYPGETPINKTITTFKYQGYSHFSLNNFNAEIKIAYTF